MQPKGEAIWRIEDASKNTDIKILTTVF
ncbi:Unannotated [Lentimonas sp. CC10]|nr:Unannotated [Lentimonas sp. CC10]